MPTARELLEQVDALMRRNRAGEAAGAMPAGVAEIPSGDVADTEVMLDGARAPDLVPDLQEAPSEHGSTVEVEAAPRIDLPSAPEEDFPLLTEAVPLDVEVAPAPASVQDDVPLLTDAVDDAELAGMLHEVHAARPAVAGDEAAAVAAPLPSGEPLWRADRTGVAEDAGQHAPDEPDISIWPPAMTFDDDIDAPPPRAPMPVIEVPEAGRDGIAAPDASPAATPISTAELVDMRAELADVPAAPVVEESDANTGSHAVAADEAPGIATVPSGEPATSDPAAGAPPADTLHAPSAAAPEVQSRLALDDPRWVALAEEVRMQVLQRIDLFTESGLQGELRQHLQPIVDRASAELVATITREVGQVLRSYVAQAIEREIDKWRGETH